jgi:hypothetical protein
MSTGADGDATNTAATRDCLPAHFRIPTMRHASTFPLLLCAALAAAGCQPQATAPAAVDAVQERAAATDDGHVAATTGAPGANPQVNAPGTDAVVVADHTAPALADPNFEARGFAGTFASPQRQLEIAADGRYVLHAGDDVSAGSWSLESGSGLLLLDPDAKDAGDQRFAMPSSDELAPQDGSISLLRAADHGGQ